MVQERKTVNSWKDARIWGGFSAPRAEGGAGTSRVGPVWGERSPGPFGASVRRARLERAFMGEGAGARLSRETEQTFRWCAFFCVGGTAREVPAPPSARGAVGRLGRGTIQCDRSEPGGSRVSRPTGYGRDKRVPSVYRFQKKTDKNVAQRAVRACPIHRLVR